MPSRHKPLENFAERGYGSIPKPSQKKAQEAELMALAQTNVKQIMERKNAAKTSGKNIPGFDLRVGHAKALVYAF